jgi:basic amino acid/polyamine antiporter, APA family
VLGLSGVAGSEAVAGDVMRLTFGESAAWLIGLMVAIAALTSANATIFTGARTNYALGRDFRGFSRRSAAGTIRPTRRSTLLSSRA